MASLPFKFNSGGAFRNGKYSFTYCILMKNEVNDRLKAWISPTSFPMLSSAKENMNIHILKLNNEIRDLNEYATNSTHIKEIASVH
tara:strand:+ start:1938 stop:2195 length:258 start_codon:yes stop_codon:yes gene_type:complete